MILVRRNLIVITRLLDAKLNKKCQVNLKKLIFPEGVQTVIVPNMYRKIKQNYCEDCDYTYTDKSSFNKHLRAKHKDKVASMEFQCKQCDRGFMKKHHLQTHISMVHNKIQRGLLFLAELVLSSTQCN